MKKINWTYALGEVLLIFVGITLAIAFQNWNEQRKQGKLELAVLEQMKEALQKDYSDVQANIATHNRGQKGCQGILAALSSPESLDAQVFLEDLIQAIDYTFLVSDVSTYEYLKSVGLHIIGNDSLRRQITNLYDVVYESIYGVENNAKPIQQNVVNHAKKYFSANQKFFTPLENINEIKNDNELKFDLKNLEFAHRVMILKYKEQIKPELELLIKMVDEELEER